MTPPGETPPPWERVSLPPGPPRAARITLDEHVKCVHCGKSYATLSGRCLACIAKLIEFYGLDRATWPRDGRVKRPVS